MLSRCPIYNNVMACDTHPDCLFLRNGGCAVVLAATLGDENQKDIKQLRSEVQDVGAMLRGLIDALNRGLLSRNKA
jgi:hypothetical protein